MAYQNASILVVDDNGSNRDLLARRLERGGYTNLTAAEDGLVALELLADRPFDLVLLDLMMPNMSGTEVLERIKGDPGLREVPVLIISAVEESESVVKCIELGADDYLTKPFDPAVLQARVGACLEKRRLRTQEAEYTRSLRFEKQRSEAILHAILPPGAVRELKASNEVRPRRYDNIALLFCDIVGFTRYCDTHPPEEVVAQLQSLMIRFEDAIEANGMEKVKTIGDAVFATADLLNHVEILLRSAGPICPQPHPQPHQAFMPRFQAPRWGGAILLIAIALIAIFREYSTQTLLQDGARNGQLVATTLHNSLRLRYGTDYASVETGSAGKSSSIAFHDRISADVDELTNGPCLSG